MAQELVIRAKKKMRERMLNYYQVGNLMLFNSFLWQWMSAGIREDMDSGVVQRGPVLCLDCEGGLQM